MRRFFRKSKRTSNLGELPLHSASSHQERKALIRDAVAFQLPIASKPVYFDDRQNFALRHSQNLNYIPRPFFTGIVDKVFSDNAKSSGTQLVVLWGLAGTGKTELALDYAYQNRDTYNTVLWIRAGSAFTLEQDLIRAYHMLYGILTGSEDDVNLENALAGLRDWAFRRDEPWLIVFDNAVELDIMRFIPDVASLRVIITSRNRISHGTLSCMEIEIGPMEESQAIELFLEASKLSNDDYSNDMHELSVFISKLGGLALAISVLAAHMREMDLSVRDCLRSGEDLEIRMSPYVGLHHGKVVSAVFEMTFQDLSRGAATLLQMLFFLDPQDIRADIFETQHRPLPYANLVATYSWRSLFSPEVPPDSNMIKMWFLILQRSALLRSTKNEWAYEIHEVTRTWGLDRLSRPEQQKFSVAVLDLLVDTIDTYEMLPYNKSRLLPHLMANFWSLKSVHSRPHQISESALHKLTKVGIFVTGLGRLHEGYAIQQYVSDESANTLGEDHSSSIDALKNLAITSRYLGQLQEAEDMENMVLEKSKPTLGSDHADSTSPLNSQAPTIGESDVLNEAVNVPSQGTSTRIRDFGDNHLSTIGPMIHLANTLRDNGNLEEAIDLKREVAKRMKDILGEDDPDTISALNSLAVTLGEQGKSTEGLEIQTQVMEKRRRLLGNQHPVTISAVYNLAVAYEAFGRSNQAAALLQESISAMNEIYGTDHPRTMTAVSRLARITEREATTETNNDLKIASEDETHAFSDENLTITPEYAYIVVVGATGAGKSTFIRAITGGTSIKVESSLQSEEELEAYNIDIDGQVVVLVEAVGFGNTFKDDIDVIKEIMYWLAARNGKKIPLAGIFYMLDMSMQRFPASIMRNLRLFQDLMGQNALKKVVFVANKGVRVGSPVFEIRLAELQELFDVRVGLIGKMSAVESFSGTDEDARRILRCVLDKQRTAVLNIQHKSIERSIDLSETNAGKAVLRDLDKIRAEQELEVAKLRSGVNDDLKLEDDELDAIAEERLGFERKLKRSEDQISELELGPASVLEELQPARRPHNEDLSSVLEKQFALPPAYNAAQTANMDLLQTPSKQPTDSLRSAMELLSFNDTWVQQPDYRTNWTQLIDWLGNPIPNLLICGARLYRNLARTRVLWQLGKRLLRRRPAPGYRRLEWRCTCGELLYGDFRENTPESLDQLVAKLNEHSAQDSQQTTATSSQPSARASLRHNAAPVGWNMPGNSGASGSNSPGNSSAATIAPVVEQQAQRGLQLCVETGRYTLELCEIRSEPHFSDGLLFERMRTQYEQTRRSALPIWLRFRKPDEAIFIKFRQSRKPYISRIEGTLEAPSIPSKDEVMAGNYSYNPCPIDEPPMDSRTFLHHFYAPAFKHPDKLWSMRLPWKERLGLATMDTGWGIRLEERPDWPLFAALMFICLLLSGLVAGIYAWRTGENQVGIAIGTWLTAVQAMGMSAVFLWWK